MLTASGVPVFVLTAGGNAIITSTASLALPRIVPLASGMLVLTVRVLDGVLGGCTCTWMRPNSLLALSLLVALTFLMVVTVVVATPGSTMIETSPIWLCTCTRAILEDPSGWRFVLVYVCELPTLPRPPVDKLLLTMNIPTAAAMATIKMPPRQPASRKGQRARRLLRG